MTNPLRWAVLSVLIVVSGCREINEPTRGNPQITPGYDVNTLGNGHVVASSVAHTFEMDEPNNTLTVDGRRIKLSKHNSERIGKSMRAMANTDAVIARLNANKQFAALVAANQPNNDHRYRLSVASHGESARSIPVTPLTSIPDRFEPRFSVGSNPDVPDYTCSELILTITQLTYEYNQAKAEYFDKLGEVFLGMLPGGDDKLKLPEFDVTDAVSAADQAELEVMFYDIMDLWTQLNFLAALSNLNNCIYGPGDQPVSSQPSGGGSPSQDCWDEPGYIEVSTDGGNSWHRIWEGTVRVCNGQEVA